MFIIIPDTMEHAIKRDLDALRDGLPENERDAFEAQRDIHRKAIIDYFGKHGCYPEIGGIEKIQNNEENNQ